MQFCGVMAAIARMRHLRAVGLVVVRRRRPASGASIAVSPQGRARTPHGPFAVRTGGREAGRPTRHGRGQSDSHTAIARARSGGELKNDIFIFIHGSCITWAP